ncbi:hypothetical protein KSF_082430 [Reticulibacter mediterranei]|uniref:Uncharacterized protein n=1 Tax=Reticulibacter mediterranei TaxID=2778369 RepID=A0A8J3ITD7_9CHLR|nr:hypothetical protein [Reticulibacter mediterranei]GHO98195.1 hypothetical protein KSF_082430 [Reticulibacter mediterranei]
MTEYGRGDGEDKPSPLPFRQGKAISLDLPTFNQVNAQRLYMLTEAMVREQGEDSQLSPHRV